MSGDVKARAAAVLAAAVERVVADVDTWHVYESRDTGDVFPASSVRDAMDDLRAALATVRGTDTEAAGT